MGTKTMGELRELVRAAQEPGADEELVAQALATMGAFLDSDVALGDSGAVLSLERGDVVLPDGERASPGMAIGLLIDLVAGRSVMVTASKDGSAYAVSSRCLPQDIPPAPEAMRSTWLQRLVVEGENPVQLGELVCGRLRQLR